MVEFLKFEVDASITENGHIFKLNTNLENLKNGFLKNVGKYRKNINKREIENQIKSS